MKKYYYFSKKNLKFIEIKNYYRKFIFVIFLLSLLTSFLVFGAYFSINEILNPNSAVRNLRSENEELKTKLESSLNDFQNVNLKLDSMSVVNNDLRLATNLEPIYDQRNIGTGGSIFDNVDPTNSDEMQIVITSLQQSIDDAKLKSLITSLKDVDIDKELESASVAAVAPAASGAAEGGEAKAEDNK